jgi:hypothetical protein
MGLSFFKAGHISSVTYYQIVPMLRVGTRRLVLSKNIGGKLKQPSS